MKHIHTDPPINAREHMEPAKKTWVSICTVSSARTEVCPRRCSDHLDVARYGATSRQRAEPNQRTDQPEFEPDGLEPMWRAALLASSEHICLRVRSITVLLTSSAAPRLIQLPQPHCTHPVANLFQVQGHEAAPGEDQKPVRHSIQRDISRWPLRPLFSAFAYLRPKESALTS